MEEFIRLAFVFIVGMLVGALLNSERKDDEDDG